MSTHTDVIIINRNETSRYHHDRPHNNVGGTSYELDYAILHYLVFAPQRPRSASDRLRQLSNVRESQLCQFHASSTRRERREPSDVRFIILQSEGEFERETIHKKMLFDMVLVRTGGK